MAYTEMSQPTAAEIQRDLYNSDPGMVLRVRQQTVAENQNFALAVISLTGSFTPADIPALESAIIAAHALIQQCVIPVGDTTPTKEEPTDEMALVGELRIRLREA